MSNDGLETVIKKHGASLRVLEMFGCFNITPRGLQAVSNNCINLISLHLGQCYKVRMVRVPTFCLKLFYLKDSLSKGNFIHGCFI